MNRFFLWFARSWPGAHRNQMSAQVACTDAGRQPSATFLIVICAAALLGGGCAATRQAPFVEADFARTAGHGSGQVSGHAFGITDEGETLNANHELVVLAPVTPYTAENIRRRFVNGEPLLEADHRLGQYLRTTKANARGSFAFSAVPAGDYYVQTEVDWTTSYVECNNDGISSTMYVDHHKLVFSRVSVNANQSVQVASWDQSSPSRKAFYAYGGILSTPGKRRLTSPKSIE